jgi:D-glycero-D-manno-heptose 1,7-bisphosphate phosphatase
MGTPERLREVSQQVAAGVPGRLSDTGVRKCVFVDRDGVINEDVGHLRNIDDFRILDGVPLAIKRLNNAGYLVICVTNQPVVARGELEERDLAVIHMKLEAELGKEGAYLDGLYYCPHHPDAGFPGEVPELKIICDCRKPAPGMLQLACDDYGIDASSSWMIGDHERDIKAGASAGMNTILIYDESTVIEHSVEIADHQCDDLLSAVEWILSESSASSDQGR